MRAIVRILKNPSSARALLTYCYRQRTKDDEQARAEVVAVEGNVAAGVLLRDARLDAGLFESRCPAGRRAAGHVVISAERDEPGVESRLLRAGHDWAGRYIPGRGYVIVVHRKDADCSHTHAHLVFERYGEKGVAARFSRSDMKEMCGMKFTSEFQPVRADGSRSPHRGASQVYPAARRLVARDLALRMVAGETDWSRLQRERDFAPGRVKEGALVSFSYRGQRLRVATIEKLVQRERGLRAQRAAGVVAKEAGRGMSSLFSLGDELAAAVSDVEQVAQAKSPGRSR